MRNPLFVCHFLLFFVLWSAFVDGESAVVSSASDEFMNAFASDTEFDQGHRYRGWTIGWSIMNVITFVLNTLVVTTISRSSELNRNISICLFAAQAIKDLCFGAVCAVFHGFYAIQQTFLGSSFGCSVFAYSGVLLLGVTISTLIVLSHSCRRALLVDKPISNQEGGIYFAIAWLLSIGIACYCAIASPGQLEPTGVICTADHQKLQIAVVILTGILIGLTYMVVTWSLIFCFAPRTFDDITSAEASLAEHQVKVSRTILLQIIFFVACWFPSMLLPAWEVGLLTSRRRQTPDWLVLAAATGSTLNSFVNPIIVLWMLPLVRYHLGMFLSPLCVLFGVFTACFKSVRENFKLRELNGYNRRSSDGFTLDENIQTDINVQEDIDLNPGDQTLRLKAKKARSGAKELFPNTNNVRLFV